MTMTYYIVYFFVPGIGYEILVDMLKHMSPTHVVKIRISAQSKNLPAGAFWLNEGNADAVTVIEINAAIQDHLNRSYDFFYLNFDMNELVFLLSITMCNFLRFLLYCVTLDFSCEGLHYSPFEIACTSFFYRCLKTRIMYQNSFTV